MQERRHDLKIELFIKREVERNSLGNSPPIHIERKVRKCVWKKNMGVAKPGFDGISQLGLAIQDHGRVTPKAFWRSWEGRKGCLIHHKPRVKGLASAVVSRRGPHFLASAPQISVHHALCTALGGMVPHAVHFGSLHLESQVHDPSREKPQGRDIVESHP